VRMRHPCQVGINFCQRVSCAGCMLGLAPSYQVVAGWMALVEGPSSRNQYRSIQEELHSNPLPSMIRLCLSS
jgi:hypothetical protein